MMLNLMLPCDALQILFLLVHDSVLIGFVELFFGYVTLASGQVCLNTC